MKHLLLLALLLVSVFIAEAAPAAVDKEIRFARGANSTLINGSVIRGESDQYSLAAKAGQKMAVTITSLEKNAAFTIYQPGYQVDRDADGILEFKGATLPGAGESDAAASWKGDLPTSGTYLILVGPTRGNAAYKLKISIH